MQGYNFVVPSTSNNPETFANPGTLAAASSGDQIPRTPLSLALGASELRVFAGVRTPGFLDNPKQEMASLITGAAIADLGWRAKIRVNGKDRVRWLNGMVTNTVQALAQDQGNYNFLLNAQGRIQGDCYVYRHGEDLLLDTSHDQIPALLRHLDRYIIMDDVELQEVSDRWTALALIGPKAPRILSALGSDLGAALPAAVAGGSNRLLGTIRVDGVEVLLVEAYHVLVPRYELWLAPSDVLTLWQALQGASAMGVGLDAVENLRVLDGIPLYGIDLNERDLPQETNQARALNFNKGCYLGQEIVERIRSRGKVHRRFRQWALDGFGPALPIDLWSGDPASGDPASRDQAIGRITSVTSLSTPGLPGTFGLGFAREEIVEGQAPIRYEGGTATPLEGPPHLPG
jgi:folate-binding protein YgfZ